MDNERAPLRRPLARYRGLNINPEDLVEPPRIERNLLAFFQNMEDRENGPGRIHFVNPPDNIVQRFVPEQILGRNFQVAIEFGLPIADDEDEDDDEEAQVSCVMTDREFALKHVCLINFKRN